MKNRQLPIRRSTQSKNPGLRFAMRLIIAVASGVLTSTAWAATCYDQAAPHQCLKSNNAVNACQDVLRSDPYDLQVRFSLCAAQVKANVPLKALIVLDQGLKLCGQDRNTCARLEAAIASLEQESKQQTGSAEFRAGQEENRRECVNRKGKSVHQGIIACEEALLAFPNDADLHSALGEKQLKGGEPARAVLSFRRALVIRPGDPNFLSWHDAAENERQTLVERCLRHTDLQRCNRAIIPGSKDEASLHLKRSNLYLQQGNRPAALEALLIVQVIDPRDVATSQRLLNLVPANVSVKDERLYLARGRALLVTGDVNRAIVDLRRATNRALDREAALAELERARLLRQVVVKRACFDARDAAACRDLIIEGEPDEQQIRQLIAQLDAPLDAPPTPPMATVATVAAAPVTTPKPITRTATQAKPVVRNKTAQRPAANDKERRLQLAATYINIASNDGVTH